MIDELLAVLDMPEEEQEEWCRDKTMPYRWRESLADLAFRLRDEAVVNQGEVAWHRAVVKVCDYMGKRIVWFKGYAQPIHWVIAALIAKEK